MSYERRAGVFLANPAVHGSVVRARRGDAPMSGEEPETAAADPEGDAVDMALDAALSEPAEGAEAAADPLADEADALADHGAEAGGDWVSEMTDALTRSPAKSIHEIDESEYFDPEAGGKNRLLLVADDIVTQGDGLQNWMHLVIGAVEITLQEAAGESGESQSHETGDTALEETDTSGVDIA